MIDNKKLLLTLAATALALAHILFEFLTGGVATHYPMADASNPGISNWWGLMTIPLLTWIVLSVIERRRPESEVESGQYPAIQTRYFVAGLVFGLIMSLLWELGQSEILQYLILTPWMMALLLRVYLPETTLGFVLGMVYTFGGVLPIIFSAVIQTIGFLIYLVFNRGGRWLIARIKS